MIIATAAWGGVGGRVGRKATDGERSQLRGCLDPIGDVARLLSAMDAVLNADSQSTSAARGSRRSRVASPGVSGPSCTSVETRASAFTRSA